MTGGHRPQLPGLAPGTAAARLPPAADSHPVDLTAIRRDGALIDSLACRRLLRRHARGDPALALLASLAADVDAALGTRLAAAVVSAAGARLAGTVGRPTPGAGQAARRPRRAGRHRRPSGLRAPAAAMIAVLATLAAGACLLAASVTIRLGAPGRHSGGR
jgi:hypothetical protein